MVKSLKVVVLGARGVGKTTILKQVLYGNVIPTSVSNKSIPDFSKLTKPKICIGRQLSTTENFCVKSLSFLKILD